jgi:hypothetical protein
MWWRIGHGGLGVGGVLAWSFPPVMLAALKQSMGRGRLAVVAKDDRAGARCPFDVASRE